MSDRMIAVALMPFLVASEWFRQTFGKSRRVGGKPLNPSANLRGS
jgi:hypothetical protein